MTCDNRSEANRPYSRKFTLGEGRGKRRQNTIAGRCPGEYSPRPREEIRKRRTALLSLRKERLGIGAEAFYSLANGTEGGASSNATNLISNLSSCAYYVLKLWEYSLHKYEGLGRRRCIRADCQGERFGCLRIVRAAISLSETALMAPRRLMSL